MTISGVQTVRQVHLSDALSFKYQMKGVKRYIPLVKENITPALDL